MEQRITPTSKRHEPPRRAWIAAITLAVIIPLALVIPALAQELDPLDAMRAEFDACIASGAEGSVCAEEAKSHLDAIMSGSGPVSTGTGSPAEAPPAGGPAGSQTSSASGQDGEVSHGGDQAASGDTATDAVDTSSPPPAPASAATPEPTTVPPPAPDAAPADDTASTTSTTDAAPGTTATLSGGAQTHDASGTDGGRPGR